jgi:hypothetical protein
MFLSIDPKEILNISFFIKMYFILVMIWILDGFTLLLEVNEN